MQIKAPNFLHTFRLFERLGSLLTFGKVAQCCGKEMQTAEAWGREPASNENPTGSGRKNPIDCILRLMGVAHKEGDRALVREIAETFTEYADFLDEKEISINTDLDELVGKSAKEHGEAIFEALRRKNWASAITEITQAEIALRDLKSFAQVQGNAEKASARYVTTSRNGGTR